MSYDAILFTSFGGPESPEEVMPFLERVTAGRGVPRERLEEVSHHYLALGGVSPINQQNRDLIKALKNEFELQGINIPIYWGNRNSEPFYADALREIHDAGHKRVLAFVTSAYSSYSGCRQYRENLAKALDETGLSDKLVVDKVRHYFDHPGFILPFAKGLAEALENAAKANIDSSKLKIFFTTHSIPNSMADTSGPIGLRESHAGGMYVAQHLKTAELVIENCKLFTKIESPEWELVYQSRSGSPSIPWLEPDIGDAIRAEVGTSKQGVIVIPIGFISDHVEVIWDLDNEAKEIAKESGFYFDRVATPGIDHEFVQGITKLVQERINPAVENEKLALSSLGPWPDFCSVGCCPNSRNDLPTVAESKEV